MRFRGETAVVRVMWEVYRGHGGVQALFLGAADDGPG
jgi:hypothetical protein